jgi:hypothetical protein
MNNYTFFIGNYYLYDNIKSYKYTYNLIYDYGLILQKYEKLKKNIAHVKSHYKLLTPTLNFNKDKHNLCDVLQHHPLNFNNKIIELVNKIWFLIDDETISNKQWIEENNKYICPCRKIVYYLTLIDNYNIKYSVLIDIFKDAMYYNIYDKSLYLIYLQRKCTKLHYDGLYLKKMIDEIIVEFYNDLIIHQYVVSTSFDHLFTIIPKWDFLSIKPPKIAQLLINCYKISKQNNYKNWFKKNGSYWSNNKIVDNILINESLKIFDYSTLEFILMFKIIKFIYCNSWAIYVNKVIINKYQITNQNDKTINDDDKIFNYKKNHKQNKKFQINFNSSEDIFYDDMF